VKAFFRFVRSLLPVDASQAMLVLGSLCLFIAAYLRWAPWQILRPLPRAVLLLSIVASIAIHVVRFSACLGFLICFRPGTHPVRRIVYWVALPTMLGIALVCSYCVYALSVLSIMPGGGVVTKHVRSIMWIIANLGEGFQYAVLGLILILIFALWLGLGHTSLPLALPDTRPDAPEDSNAWSRIEMYIWVLLFLLNAIHAVFPFQTLIYYFVKTHIPTVSNITALSAEQFATDSILLLIAVWIIGKGAWYAVRRCVRLPEIDEFALAAAFPIGITAFLYGGKYLYGLTRWAVQQSHNVSAPWIGSHLSFPKAVLLVLLLPALGEEILFRGLLQPRFLSRYGLFRGLVLLSMVFAAAHISADFSAGYGFTDGLVILKLGARLISSIGLCFVTGWLTLRTGSVLPATLAHGISNIMVVSPLGPAIPGAGPLSSVLWVALAYSLFRYWPIQEDRAQRAFAASPANTLTVPPPPCP
jgi:membrane protease YdiL (CAAX protease family)